MSPMEDELTLMGIIDKLLWKGVSLKDIPAKLVSVRAMTVFVVNFEKFNRHAANFKEMKEALIVTTDVLLLVFQPLHGPKTTTVISNSSLTNSYSASSHYELPHSH